MFRIQRGRLVGGHGLSCISQLLDLLIQVSGSGETLILPTMSLLTGLKATEPSLSVLL